MTHTNEDPRREAANGGRQHHEESTTLTRALQYASRGIPVFPCRPENKRPHTEHGFKNASTDPETIRAWWGKYPAAMIGAPTGKESGLVAVDMDPRNEKGFDGMAAFAEIVSERGTAIRTLKTRTPSGGLHLVFKHPGETVKNSAGKIAAGVDTRGDGGYIILPPSKATAGEYRFESDTPPQPLPAWLCDLLREAGIMGNGQGHGRTTVDFGETLPDPERYPPGIPPSVRERIERGAPEGQRNEAALHIACELRDEGHPPAVVEGYVLTFAGNCTPPMQQTEARSVVKSAFSRPPRDTARNPSPTPRSNRTGATVHVVSAPPTEPPEPWTAPAPLGGLSEPPPPWPWDAIPEPLRSMGQEIERTYNVPAEMAGAAVLGVASIALKNTVRVEIKRDHRQFGNLFFMVAAGVASGKSPVMKAAQGPLVDWQHDNRETWKRLRDQWDARQRRVWAEIKGLEKQAERVTKGKDDMDALHVEREIARLRGELEDPPPEPLLFAEDVTSEKLGRLMSERGGAIGVLSGEARKILAIARGRYVEGGDIDLWLKGHAGDRCRVDRSGKDKPSYEIHEACLAAAIMTQPDSLQALGECEAMRESGFLARWVYLVPDHTRGEYPVESVSAATAARYGDAIRRMIELPPAQSEDGTDAPHLLKLSQDAFAFWKRYHDMTSWEICDNATTKPRIYLQWLGKLPEHIARLGAVFHVLGHVAEGLPLGTLTGEIEQSAVLADCLKVHARRAIALLGEDGETAKARKGWEWIDRNRQKLAERRASDEPGESLGHIEAVKPRDLDRAGTAGVKNSAEADKLLGLLADKGWLQAVEIKPEKGKGQRLYLIHPDPAGSVELRTPPARHTRHTRHKPESEGGMSGMSDTSARGEAEIEYEEGEL